MWIKELPKDYKKHSSFFDNVVFLWKSDEHPIYVSDNHLTAAWCWMQECGVGERYNFMHIDRHSDLKGAGHLKDIEHLKDNPKIPFEDYLGIKYNNGGTYQFFQWDNYIRACHHLFPEWFNTNYFYTHEAVFADANPWGYKEFFFQRRNAVFVREDFTQFTEEAYPYLGDGPEGDMWDKPWIINLDLDFFWDDNRKRIFHDQFIREFAKRLRISLKNIKVLTIALSPECVGGCDLEMKWDNVLEVFNIFIEDLDLSIVLN